MLEDNNENDKINNYNIKNIINNNDGEMDNEFNNQILLYSNDMDQYENNLDKARLEMEKECSINKFGLFDEKVNVDVYLCKCNNEPLRICEYCTHSCHHGHKAEKIGKQAVKDFICGCGKNGHLDEQKHENAKKVRGGKTKVGDKDSHGCKLQGLFENMAYQKMFYNKKEDEELRTFYCLFCANYCFSENRNQGFHPDPTKLSDNLQSMPSTSNMNCQCTYEDKHDTTHSHKNHNIDNIKRLLQDLIKDTKLKEDLKNYPEIKPYKISYLFLKSSGLLYTELMKNIIIKKNKDFKTQIKDGKFDDIQKTTSKTDYITTINILGDCLKPFSKLSFNLSSIDLSSEFEKSISYEFILLLFSMVPKKTDYFLHVKYHNLRLFRKLILKPMVNSKFTYFENDDSNLNSAHRALLQRNLFSDQFIAGVGTDESEHFFKDVHIPQEAFLKIIEKIQSSIVQYITKKYNSDEYFVMSLFGVVNEYLRIIKLMLSYRVNNFEKITKVMQGVLEIVKSLYDSQITDKFYKIRKGVENVVYKCLSRVNDEKFYNEVYDTDHSGDKPKFSHEFTGLNEILMSIFLTVNINNNNIETSHKSMTSYDKIMSMLMLKDDFDFMSLKTLSESKFKFHIDFENEINILKFGKEFFEVEKGEASDLMHDFLTLKIKEESYVSKLTTLFNIAKSSIIENFKSTKTMVNQIKDKIQKQFFLVRINYLYKLLNTFYVFKNNEYLMEQTGEDYIKTLYNSVYSFILEFSDSNPMVMQMFFTEKMINLLWDDRNEYVKTVCDFFVRILDRLKKFHYKIDLIYFFNTAHTTLEKHNYLNKPKDHLVILISYFKLIAHIFYNSIDQIIPLISQQLMPNIIDFIFGSTTFDDKCYELIEYFANDSADKDLKNFEKDNEYDLPEKKEIRLKSDFITEFMQVVVILHEHHLLVIISEIRKVQLKQVAKVEKAKQEVEEYGRDFSNDENNKNFELTLKSFSLESFHEISESSYFPIKLRVNYLTLFYRMEFEFPFMVRKDFTFGSLFKNLKIPFLNHNIITEVKVELNEKDKIKEENKNLNEKLMILIHELQLYKKYFNRMKGDDPQSRRKMFEYFAFNIIQPTINSVFQITYFLEKIELDSKYKIYQIVVLFICCFIHFLEGRIELNDSELQLFDNFLNIKKANEEMLNSKIKAMKMDLELLYKDNFNLIEGNLFVIFKKYLEYSHVNSLNTKMKNLRFLKTEVALTKLESNKSNKNGTNTRGFHQTDSKMSIEMTNQQNSSQKGIVKQETEHLIEKENDKFSKRLLLFFKEYQDSKDQAEKGNRIMILQFFKEESSIKDNSVDYTNNIKKNKYTQDLKKSVFTLLYNSIITVATEENLKEYKDNIQDLNESYKPYEIVARKQEIKANTPTLYENFPYLFTEKNAIIFKKINKVFFEDPQFCQKILKENSTRTSIVIKETMNAIEYLFQFFIVNLNSMSKKDNILTKQISELIEFLRLTCEDHNNEFQDIICQDEGYEPIIYFIEYIRRYINHYISKKKSVFYFEFFSPMKYFESMIKKCYEYLEEIYQGNLNDNYLSLITFLSDKEKFKGTKLADNQSFLMDNFKMMEDLIENDEKEFMFSYFLNLINLLLDSVEIKKKSDRLDVVKKLDLKQLVWVMKMSYKKLYITFVKTHWKMENTNNYHRSHMDLKNVYIKDETFSKDNTFILIKNCGILLFTLERNYNHEKAHNLITSMERYSKEYDPFAPFKTIEDKQLLSLIVKGELLMFMNIIIKSVEINYFIKKEDDEIVNDDAHEQETMNLKRAFFTIDRESLLLNKQDEINIYIDLPEDDYNQKIFALINKRHDVVNQQKFRKWIYDKNNKFLYIFSELNYYIIQLVSVLIILAVNIGLQWTMTQDNILFATKWEWPNAINLVHVLLLSILLIIYGVFAYMKNIIFDPRKKVKWYEMPYYFISHYFNREAFPLLWNFVIGILALCHRGFNVLLFCTAF